MSSGVLSLDSNRCFWVETRSAAAFELTGTFKFECLPKICGQLRNEVAREREGERGWERAREWERVCEREEVDSEKKSLAKLSHRRWCEGSSTAGPRNILITPFFAEEAKKKFYNIDHWPEKRQEDLENQLEMWDDLSWSHQRKSCVSTNEWKFVIECANNKINITTNSCSWCSSLSRNWGVLQPKWLFIRNVTSLEKEKCFQL